MERKGQAAMEFLMTYGWAILAAIVVIAVLAIYFNPSQMVNSQTIISAPFNAKSQAVSASQVQIEVTNKGGEWINVTEFTVNVRSPTTATCTTNTSSVVFENGDTKILGLECSGLPSGQTMSGDVVVKYLKRDSSLATQSTGSISAKVA